MIDITDKTHMPSLEEIDELIENPLFPTLCAHMKSTFGAHTDIAYSGDNALLGWNVRFHKSGRTLLRLYPRRGYFPVLVVIGRKEKPHVEAFLPGMSAPMRALYEGTQECMGQRWLITNLAAPDALYRDILMLVSIRRESKKPPSQSAASIASVEPAAAVHVNSCGK